MKKVMTPFLGWSKLLHKIWLISVNKISVMKCDEKVDNLQNMCVKNSEKVC